MYPEYSRYLYIYRERDRSFANAGGACDERKKVESFPSIGECGSDCVDLPRIPGSPDSIEKSTRLWINPVVRPMELDG
jgi:hypothetical protein